MIAISKQASLLLSGLLLTLLAPQTPSSASPGYMRPATDEQIKQILAEASSAEDYDNAEFMYVLDEADVHVDRTGLARTESCQVIKILTNAGVRSQSVLHDNFDPDTNLVNIRSVRIHHADGRIEEVSVSNVVTQPAPERWMFWGGEQHLLSIPRLEVGDALEIRRSKVGFNIAYLHGETDEMDASHLEPPMEGHWFEVTEFQVGHPIAFKRYTVHMPSDMPVQYKVYNGSLETSLWFDGDHHVYTFIAHDMPALHTEPHMVANSDVVPKVVMATVPSWEMKSRWFYEVNETQFDADDAIRAKVQEITGHLDSEEAKIQACLHWVADNIRYYGTSRGPREGFTLHKGIETFHDRGGVCKDIAGMLITMLRVLGHETYASLTMAMSRVEQIPADQFNHTVCVMRNPDGTFRILDPTWSPLSKELWSSREALQGLVYGTPEGQTLTLSPYFSPEENLAHCRTQSEIADDGSLRMDVRMDLTGYSCTYLRRYADRDRPFDQKARFEGYLNIAPDARIDQYDHIEPRDYSRDGWAEMTISAPRYAAGAGELRMFRLPMMQHPLDYILIRDLTSYDFSAEERRFPLRMRATRLLRYEETIRLPEGWRVISAPEPCSLSSPLVSLDFRITHGQGELSYVFEFTLKDHMIQPEDYAGFKQAIDKMNELTDQWIICRTGG